MVKLAPDNEVSFALIIGAPELVIPFTVTVEVFTLDALETPLTASDDEVMPFTLDVNVFPDKLKALVVPAVIAGVKSRAVLATPFTVVVKLVPDNDVSFVLIIGAPELVIPSTVIVEVFPLEAFETVIVFVIAEGSNIAPPSVPTTNKLFVFLLTTCEVDVAPASLVYVIVPVPKS